MSGISGLIDVHHHIIPKEYIEALAKIGVNTSIGRTFPDWDVATTLLVMDQNGIETSIVSISAPGVYFPGIDRPREFAADLARKTNEICAGLIDDHPGRFGAFATLPLPDVDAALVELKYALDVLKLDGVVLMSNYEGYYLGDPRFDRLMAELNRRKAIVFIHPCSPPGIERSHLGFPELMMDVCFDTTRTAYSLILKGAIRKYPDIRFILAHAGGTVPYIAWRVALYAAFAGLKETIPEGLEFYLKKFYYDTALSASPYAFASLQRLTSASQVLFGTDYVFLAAAGIPYTIKGIVEFNGYSVNDIAAIERKNAIELFPRLK